MEYSILSGYYQRLEVTPSRLEMTDILVELFNEIPEDLIEPVVYLTLGKLCPDYEGLEFGIADKMVIKALAFTTGHTEQKVLGIWNQTGDPGDAAEILLKDKKQRSLFSTPLTLQRVFSTFHKLAGISGKGTMDVRIKYLAELLHDASPLDGRYIARTVVGKLRLGVADMTIIDALAVRYLLSQLEERTNEEDIATRESVKGANELAPAEEGSVPEDEDPEFIEEENEEETITFTIAEKKELRGRIEAAYNIHPDIGLMARTMITKGPEGLEEITMVPGTPIRVMLAERLSTPEDILEKMGGRAAFEHKYDGIRIQAHIGDNEITLFTRQQENATAQFPDVVEALSEIRNGKKMIIEGECVPVDVNTGEMLPFQMVSRRRGRKYDLDKAVEEFPVVLFVFDILYFNGEDLISRPFPERRAILEEHIQITEKVHHSTLKILEDPEKVEEFFLASLDAGCEGLVAKSIADDSVYRAGARGWQWIKFKRDYRSELVDTLDLVVVGGFHGRGRRAGTHGALLMAAYNTETDMFETVCKLGSGFDDAFLQVMNSMFVPLETRSARVRSEMKADTWFEPAIVFEVLAAEITLSPIHTAAWGAIREGAGIAVRFPRFTGKIREDKRPEDATSGKELVEMYKLQVKGTE